MAIRLSERTKEAYAYPLLIKHLLHTPLAIAPHEEIVYRDQQRYTYTTLRQRIGQLANLLSRLGIEEGDTVAIMDWDSHRYLESYFAVPMMGAILQTVNVRLSPEQILYTLNHARPTVLLVHRDFLPILEGIKSSLQSVQHCVVLEDDRGAAAPPEGFSGEYEAMLGAASAERTFSDFDENAIATTFYTTGTTGAPKGVCFSHRQIVLHTLALATAFSSAPHGQSLRQGDVYMPMTPMFHVHAWGIPFIATLLGLKQVYPGRYDPATLLALKQREGVSYSHCVPTILHMVLSAAEESGADVSGWTITIGGSALSAGLARRALQHGVDIFAGYGMSETGPVQTLTRIRGLSAESGQDREIALRCKTGLPIPLVDLRIVDENMHDVPHDSRACGELVVRSPWLTQAYVGNAEASEELWRGGYLHTQDVASIDENGYVQIMDRSKDVIKSGGEWVSSLELEDLISKVPGVAEVAVIGVPDDRWGERPLALVVQNTKTAEVATEETIKDHLKTYSDQGVISKYAIPQRVLFVDALDKTSVGKLDKKKLRERHA